MSLSSAIIRTSSRPPILDAGGNWPIDIGQRDNGLLRFPPEAAAILTPFRKQVITYIYLTARGLSRGLLDSAKVSISSISDQNEIFALDLTLIVNADWTFIKFLRRDVLARVSEWSEEWSEAEKQDYAYRIYFGVLPREL